LLNISWDKKIPSGKVDVSDSKIEQGREHGSKYCV
jgi:hypothetical protein